MARALLDEARQAAGIGDWETAAACLDEAVAQDPGDADILYLTRPRLGKARQPFATALGDLDAALATGRFTYYSRRDASVLKAELLVRERRWKEALDALGSPGASRSADPAYRLIRARAFAGLGRRARLHGRDLATACAASPTIPPSRGYSLPSAGKIPASAKRARWAIPSSGRLPRYAGWIPSCPSSRRPLCPIIVAKRRRPRVRASGGKSPAVDPARPRVRHHRRGRRLGRAALRSYPVALGTSLPLRPRRKPGRKERGLAPSPPGRDDARRLRTRRHPRGEFHARQGPRDGMDAGFEAGGIVDERATSPRACRYSRLSPAWNRDRSRLFRPIPRSLRSLSPRKGEKRSYSFGPEAFSFAPIAMQALRGLRQDGHIISLIRDSAPIRRSGACAAAALSVETASGDRAKCPSSRKGLPVSATDI